MVSLPSGKKLAFYGIIAAGLAVVGFIVYKKVQSSSAEKSLRGLLSGVGASSMKAIGFDPSAIPFIGKKESQNVVAEMQQRTAPVPPHSAPQLPARASMSRVGSRGSVSAATFPGAATDRPHPVSYPAQRGGRGVGQIPTSARAFLDKRPKYTSPPVAKPARADPARYGPRGRGARIAATSTSARFGGVRRGLAR